MSTFLEKARWSWSSFDCVLLISFLRVNNIRYLSYGFSDRRTIDNHSLVTKLLYLRASPKSFCHLHPF